MKKLVLPILGIGAWITAAVIGPVAASIIDGAQSVYLLVPHADKTVVEANEFLFDAKPDDPDYDKKILGIYGIPTETPEKIIVDASKLQHPKLKPSLSYLPVDKEKGENPWQAKTVEFLARMLKGGAVITGAVFVILFALLQAAAPAAGARSAAAE